VQNCRLENGEVQLALSVNPAQGDPAVRDTRAVRGCQAGRRSLVSACLDKAMRTSVGTACRVEAVSIGFILHLKEQDRCGGLPLGGSSSRFHGAPSALSQGHVPASATDGMLRASHRGACYRSKSRRSKVTPSYLLRRHEDCRVRAALQRSSAPSRWSLPQSCGCRRMGVASLGPQSSITRHACASPQGTHIAVDESSPAPPQPGPAPENPRDGPQAAVPMAAHRLRRAPLEEGPAGSAVSMGPVDILKADIVAWHAWYEEQHDFPSRLLRVLSQGSAALGGEALQAGPQLRGLWHIHE
jgi:hypothetical protein